MKGIGGKPFIDCQDHIDVKTLKDLNTEICMGIAVSDIKAGVYGPGVSESDRYGNFMLMKAKLAKDPELLGGYRAALDKHRLNSPLFDTPVYVQSLEELYRRMISDFQSNNFNLVRAN